MGNVLSSSVILSVIKRQWLHTIVRKLKMEEYASRLTRQANIIWGSGAPLLLLRNAPVIVIVALRVEKGQQKSCQEHTNTAQRTAAGFKVNLKSNKC